MSEVPQDSAGAPNADVPVCGLIMPISATVNQTSDHWRKVRTLISRAITKAGFEPIPVWESVANDRVSERIIGNIFKFPMVIVDISDLNPNVMLELGLRLASKKPTIAVVNDGGIIPFDIRDFHIEHYPASLSILEMEDFIEKLSANIVSLYQYSQSKEYTPFLGSIVVDVISPSEREVSTNQFLIDRLDDIERKISSRHNGADNIKNTVNVGLNRTGFIQTLGETLFFVEFATDDAKDAIGWFSREVNSIDPSFSHFSAIGDNDGVNRYAIVFNSRLKGSRLEAVIAKVIEMCKRANATFGVPSDQIKAFWLAI